MKVVSSQILARVWAAQPARCILAAKRKACMVALLSFFDFLTAELSFVHRATNLMLVAAKAASAFKVGVGAPRHGGPACIALIRHTSLATIDRSKRVLPTGAWAQSLESDA
jgi:hypothetical protein